MSTQLAFQNTQLSAINRNGQIWLSSSELAKALQYSNSKAVTMIYHKYSDEFTDFMTTVLESSTVKGMPYKTRYFSLRGAHLMAMFARTKIAKDFRKWVLDVLEKESKSHSHTNQEKVSTEQPKTIEPPVLVEVVRFNNQSIDVIFFNEQPYVIIKQICDNIGLHTETQRLNVRKNKLIKNNLALIKLPCNGGSQQHLCLPISMLNVWLNSLIANHTKAKESLKTYQQQCFAFLFNYFSKNGLQKACHALPKKNDNDDSSGYEKLNNLQMRELRNKVNSLANQFGCNRIANAAIWFAIRYVTGTPSPEAFDIRHIKIIKNEVDRISALMDKFEEAKQNSERRIIAELIRKREDVDLFIQNFDEEVKQTINMDEVKLISSVRPCHALNLAEVQNV